jgi:hypothetical protein
MLLPAMIGREWKMSGIESQREFESENERRRWNAQTALFDRYQRTKRKSMGHYA